MTEPAGANAKTAPLTPDICVVGAGPGGFEVASAAALFGVSVVLIEREGADDRSSQMSALTLDALISVAARAASIAGAGPPGFASSEAQIDFAQAHAHARRVAARQAQNQSFARLGALGVTVLRGEARFASRNAIAVAGQVVRARRFVIATGSEPTIPTIDGLAAFPFLTEDSLPTLAHRPERLIVLGGAPAGVEIAQAMRRLGSDVVLVEPAGLLPGQDPEAVGAVRRVLIRDGVTLLEGHKILRVDGTRNHPRVVLGSLDEDAGPVVEGSHLLVAMGRKPDIARLDLDLGGIRSEAGRIIADSHMKTSNRRVLAIGDCTEAEPAGPRSSHVAGHQAGLAVRNILFRQSVQVKPESVPRRIRCEPELVSLGLREEEARKKGAVRMLRWPYADSACAQAEGQTEGMIKLIADSKGRILGVTIAGARAGELITPWGLAMQNGLGVKEMAALIPPAAIFSELSKRVALSFYSPMTARPGVRRLIGILRRFG